jgi:uncharacterized protein involved in exopolysaccharide biosynthesis
MATLQTLPAATTILPSGAGPASGSFAVRAFLYAVFKHRRLALGIFLVVFVSSAIAGYMRHSTWRATSRVLVKLGETVQLAPAETPSKSIGMPLSTEVINTEAEIVKSREVAEEAVRRLGRKPEEGVSMEQFVEGIRRGLAVQPTPSSNILQISYVGRSAEQVAQTVNVITEVYIEKHNQVYQSFGVHTFYQEQLGLLGNRMKGAQRKLRRYLKREGIVDVEQEIHILNQEAIEQDKGLATHRGKIKAVERKIVSLQGQVGSLPENETHAEEYIANPVVGAYREKLTQMQLELGQLEQAYMPEDRHIRDKEQQIATIQSKMKQEQGRVLSKQTVQRNSLRDDLTKNLLALRTLQEDLIARAPSLEARLDRTRTRVNELRDKRFVVANLKQDADEAAYAFDLYRKKGEEARISEAMKNQSLVNVTVVEKAAAPLTPENSRLLPALLGIIGGLGLAASMAVIVEYMNRHLRFEEEVEKYLELPVLAVIPDLETTADIATA